MVMYDENNIKKQKEILNKIIDVNSDVISEYEAQKIIQEALIKAKEDNNLDNYNISSYIKDTSRIGWKNNPKKKEDYFIKIFYNELEYAKNTYKLTNGEVMFLLSVSKYMSWEENLLIDDEGLPINQKKLIKLTNMDRKTIYKYTKSLENKKCLLRIWDGRDIYYIINPNLMFKGQKINKGIPKLFELIGYVCSRNCKDI